MPFDEGRRRAAGRLAAAKGRRRRGGPLQPREAALSRGRATRPVRARRRTSRSPEQGRARVSRLRPDISCSTRYAHADPMRPERHVEPEDPSCHEIMMRRAAEHRSDHEPPRRRSSHFVPIASPSSFFGETRRSTERGRVCKEERARRRPARCARGSAARRCRKKPAPSDAAEKRDEPEHIGVLSGRRDPRGGRPVSTRHGRRDHGRRGSPRRAAGGSCAGLRSRVRQRDDQRARVDGLRAASRGSCRRAPHHL